LKHALNTLLVIGYVHAKDEAKKQVLQKLIIFCDLIQIFIKLR